MVPVAMADAECAVVKLKKIYLIKTLQIKIINISINKMYDSCVNVILGKGWQVIANYGLKSDVRGDGGRGRIPFSGQLSITADLNKAKANKQTALFNNPPLLYGAAN